MWNSDIFENVGFWGEDGALGGKGKWEGEELIIENVYALCLEGKRDDLWKSLLTRILEEKEGRWCLCGDFNSVRIEEKCKGKVRERNKRSMRIFNEFITKAELEDLPLNRRKFTWYRSNRTSCSRLDRFLLSGN